MRICVTGANGFIGTALIPMLERDGHEVTRMMRYTSGGRYSFYDSDKVVFADLRDSDAVRAGILHAKPDVVIHLAAVSAVSYSFLHPDEVAQVTYHGTARVADAAREAGAFLLSASSSEVYGLPSPLYKYPLTEDQPRGGTSPYGAAKVAAEECLWMCMRAYGQPIAILRPFNTISRSNASVRNRHFVVERAITQALETGRISLHDPRPRRDFLFRDDHAGAYVAALAHLDEAKGNAFNVCTGDSWTIEQMARKVAELVDREYPRIVPSGTAPQFNTRGKVEVSFSAVPDRPLDIDTLWGNNEKAKVILGWKPEHTIESGLHLAVKEWAQVLGLKGAAK